MGRKELIRIIESRENTKIEQQEKPVYEKPQGAKNKYENFMYHYKWLLVAVIIGICIISVFIYDLVTKVDYDYTIMMAGSFYADGEDIDTIAENIQLYATDLNGNGSIDVNINPITISTHENADPEMQSANQMKLMAELAAQTSYIYIFDDSIYESIFKDQGLFLPIEYNGQKTDKIPVDNNKIFKGTKMESNNLYIGVFDNTQDNIKKEKQLEYYNASLELFNEIIK